MSSSTFDLIVIGGGPGGYVAAIRAAQLGLRVCCVDKEKALGGTCLRVGCIPSKALLESSERFVETRDHLKEHGIAVAGVTLDLKTMLARKDRIVRQLTGGVDGLFKKHGITRVTGAARIAGPRRVSVAGDNAIELSAPNIIIATGSVSAPLRGVAMDGAIIGDSTAALGYSDVPKHLIVIGAGYIGLELGSVWSRLGAEVTVLEYLDRILPGMDGELASAAKKMLEKQGLKFRLGARVTGAHVDAGEAVVEIEGAEPLRADRVLVAIGRKPNTGGLGLDAAGIALDERGRIRIDGHFRTTAAGFWAIGDVVRGPMLAHKAEDEGAACSEIIAGKPGHVNDAAIPGIVYTAPEIATVGQTEEQLKDAGVNYVTGKFPFIANGRARAHGHTDGFVKILAHKQTDRILGVHIIGPRAGDLIAEAVAAIEFGASAEDLARTCHAHPTLSEAVREAALDAGGRVIHV